ncbi:hypothetical protein A2U01_0033954, partial [Trifolium medium]|nr:hypothetical protein [Trifolium medium]
MAPETQTAQETVTTETTEMEDEDGIHQTHIPMTTEVAHGATKCRLFVLTLKGAAVTWFKGLEDDFIDSWRELCRAFSSHLTARKRQPKTMASLINIIRRKEESLRDYIERFIRKAIEIKGVHDMLKCYIFEKGLRNDTKYKEKLGLKEPRDMQDLLSRAQ